MRNLKKILFTVLVLMTFSACVSGKKIFFSAQNDAIHYVGRFDKTKPNLVRFDWPNSTIQFQFTGNEISLALKGGEKNYFNLFIDDSLFQVLHQPKDSILKITGIKTKGLHKLSLQKRTEGDMGISTFQGVYLPKNKKLIPSEVKPTRKIEFIGNSITCGYGTEGLSRTEKFLPSTENVNQSYALIISKALNAESHVIAHSGLGVVRNYGDKNSISTKLATMPKRFNQVLDSEDELKWDFNLWKPDMVVVNLGTNDYSTEPHPDKTVFQKAYKALLQNIAAVYGSVPIFLISGPLIEEPANSNIKEVVDAIMKSNPEANLHFIGIPKSLLSDPTDFGSDSHPSAKGQIKIAKQILPTVATVLGWKYTLD